ncbi:6-pyruvoyl-tetrahydropterin synthase [Rhizobium etli CNPAF512]|nr:6-pyruvoyl-tetrahydropterin synthase [Rhizobium etli CNPAF512]
MIHQLEADVRTVLGRIGIEHEVHVDGAEHGFIMLDKLCLGRTGIEWRRQQDRVIADVACHRRLLDHLAGRGRVGAGDQNFAGSGKILDELQHVTALFPGLAEIFTGRAVRNPAGDACLTQMDEKLFERLEVDLVVCVEGCDEGGHDAGKFHGILLSWERRFSDCELLENASLDEGDRSREWEGDDEIDQGDDRQHFDRTGGIVRNVLADEHQIRHADGGDQRALLEQADAVRQQRRDGPQHRLRQHDVDDLDPLRQAEGDTGIQLLPADRFEAGPERFAGDRAHVERQRDDARCEIRKLDAEEQRQAEEDPEELDKDRRAAEEFDIGARNGAKRQIARRARQADEEAERASKHDADDRQLDRHPQAEQQRAFEAQQDREIERHHAGLLADEDLAAAFEQADDLGDREGHGEIDERHEGEGLDGAVGLRRQRLALVHQVLDRHDRDQGALLEDDDAVGQKHRNRGAERCREDDVEHPLQRIEAERDAGVELLARHCLDRGTIGLGIERHQIEPEGHDAHRHRVEEDVEQHRHAVEDPDDLDDRRRAAEEFDEQHERQPHDLDRAHDEEGQSEAEDDAEDVRSRRQLQRNPQPLQKRNDGDGIEIERIVHVCPLLFDMEDAVDEFLGAFFARGAEHLLGRAVLDDHAARTEDDARGDVLGEPHVVGDDHHRHVLGGELQDDLFDLADELGVERRGDLVEQHQLRIEHQRAGDRHTLLLAAGKLGRIGLRLGPQPEALEQRLGAGGRLRLGFSAHFAGREDQVLGDVQMRKQRVMLKDHADRAADIGVDPGFPGRAVGRNIGLAIETDRAAVDLLQAHHHPKQRAFAAAARTDDDDAFAGLHFDIDAFQHLDCAAPIAFVERLHFHEGKAEGRGHGQSPMIEA